MGLDLEKIRSRVKKSVTTEEALKDVVPFKWPAEVLSGEKKVVITEAEKGDKDGQINVKIETCDADRE